MSNTTAAVALALAAALLAACEQNGGDAQPAAGQAETGPAAASQAGADNAALSLNNDEQKRSYALGMDIGRSLKDLPMQPNLDYLTAGLRAVVAGEEPLMAQQEAMQVMQQFMADMQAKRAEEAAAAADANRQQGEEFLAENKTKEGVQVTDSGLQYKVLETGDGASPGPGDSVTVHYEGRLIDGTVFDSSVERGEPVTFPLDAVIPGWTEALQLMQEGAKYRLFIPAELAYGERGAGAQIGPNETLIFDVTLLEVVEPPSESG